MKKKRYFARIVGFSIIADMNNRAVEMARKGKFREASVLFSEVLREGKHPAAMNNLGIIYEVFQERDRAFDMYSRACLLEPDNDKFRYNILSFLETDGRKKTGKEKSNDRREK